MAINLTRNSVNPSELLLFSCRGTGMGWKLARYGYWLVIVVGSLLLFGHEQDISHPENCHSYWPPGRFHMGVLQLVPAMLMGAAATFAEGAGRAGEGRDHLPWMGKRAQSCRLPCCGDGGELPLFRGLD